MSCYLTPWSLYSRRPGTITYSIILQWTPTWVSTTPWIWVWSMLPHHVLSWSTISKMTNCWLSISFVCWRQNPRYAYIGAGEQRWISNEIISELVHIIVSAHEVGLCREYCTARNQRNTDIPDTHRIIRFHDDRCNLSMSYYVEDRSRLKIISELVNNVVVLGRWTLSLDISTNLARTYILPRSECAM